ncbi:monovalent cation:proton antiporter-2 (CPA2) family protein [Hoeflea sp. WL0058]|uniref:Monovalent cation:proton antiporter-2 (CPA2) family protein n=2 Tax=Flavimaribacter sediminis TaxID=2865987 RepID=A0AAE2ZK24_9HYPH|nr:monovalent cation:proton antiporter-2 (CPA2) family protein [Flavimaribacter sediminis]
MHYFREALILLAGAVIAAPLAKRLGLGTVLGYLFVGILLGPMLRIVIGGGEILNFAELGVVLLLFIIGLELKPSRLLSMSREIFGLGLAQVVVTGLVLMGPILLLKLTSFNAAIIIAFGLALSSTAFALQILEERGERNTAAGQRAFSILLFQDLAIVPLLAIIPLLTPFSAEGNTNPLLDFGIAIAAIVALFIAGRYILNPIFQLIATSGAREAMIAAALLVVLGSANLMQFAGLSMAMGAFLAGVLLAESSYRHELEADIEPFRGILLALFFMAVGLSLNLDVVVENWLMIAIAVPVIMIIKSLLIYILCRLFGSSHNAAIRIAGLLPQSGEFGFVIFTAAATAGIFSSDTGSLLIAIVTVTMALTPFTTMLAERLQTASEHEELEENFENAGSDVLMIGFSRFGQIVSQTLLAGGTDVTIIDHSADQIRSASKFGFNIYFGDGARKDVLLAAGVKRAKVVAVCTHGRATTDRIVNLIQAEFPETRLLVRAYDRAHTLSLRDRGVDYEIRETLESSFVFSRKTLEMLGMDEEIADEIVSDTRRRDEDRLKVQAIEGFYAGNDMLHTRPVTPEPLIKPKRAAERIDLKDSEAEAAEAKNQ